MATSINRHSNLGTASVDESDKLPSLVTEVVDGLGRLVADHVHLAHLGLVADAKIFAKEMVLVALSSFFLLFGYTVLWLGIAMLLEKMIALEWALLLSGSLHLVGGGIALRWALVRIRPPATMRQTSDEMIRSIHALSVPRGTTPKGARAS